MTTEAKYIFDSPTETAKTFIGEIKEHLVGINKNVQGVDCNSLYAFGIEMLKQEKLGVSSVHFYAGFDKPYFCDVMSISEIREELKTKTLKTFTIRYIYNIKN